MIVELNSNVLQVSQLFLQIAKKNSRRLKKSYLILVLFLMTANLSEMLMRYLGFQKMRWGLQNIMVWHNISYKEETKENFRTEKIPLPKIQKSTDGLNIRMVETEKRISEPENRTIETNQSEWQREKRLKKKNEYSLGTCGTITKDLTFMLLKG